MLIPTNEHLKSFSENMSNYVLINNDDKSDKEMLGEKYGEATGRAGTILSSPDKDIQNNFFLWHGQKIIKIKGVYTKDEYIKMLPDSLTKEYEEGMSDDTVVFHYSITKKISDRIKFAQL